MFCNAFKATMSILACIRRQKWSKLYNVVEGLHDNSLLTCRSCLKGKKVLQNPDSFSDRDFNLLMNNHLKVITERGWVFKEPIALESLFDTFDCTMIKLNRRVDHDRRKTITGNSKSRGIARFVRKHRNIARGK